MTQKLNKSERDEIKADIEDMEEQIEILRNSEISAEKVEELVEATGRDPRDFHERVVAAVWIDECDAVVGSPTTVAGNEQPRWKNKVLFIFACGGDDASEIKRNYRELAGEKIAELQKAIEREEHSLKTGVPWYI